MLSGGGNFGKFHIGLIKALYEQDLLPRILTGSSVGSGMAAIMAGTKYSELPKLFGPDSVIMG